MILIKLFGLINKHVICFLKEKTQTLDRLNEIVPIKGTLIDTLYDKVYVLALIPQGFAKSEQNITII